MKVRYRVAFLVAAVFACGGGEAGEEQPEEPQQPAAAAPEAPPAGPIDESLAEQGEKLFQTKGCIGCHTLGDGRLTGPDLLGVTARREYGWVMAMVTNPDSMLKNDATARQLFQEYMTPMMNMGVTRQEARAIYEYLREHGDSGS